MPVPVSVVIPTYNRAPLLEQAIASVLRQTAPAHEILVIDDGSTDATGELVRGYGGRVMLLTQPHLGISAARNRGLARATGEWIALLDSDDVWEPDKLERQIAYLRTHPNCGVVHTGYYEFGDSDRVVQRTPHFFNGDGRIIRLLFGEDWICTSSVLLRRSIPVTFREWATSSEDIIFFADLLRSGVTFCCVDDLLVGRRVHDDSISRAAGSQIRGLSFQWRWVVETFASQPEKQRLLQHNLARKVVRAMRDAKWSRRWDAYWQWRHWLARHWPADLAAPADLRERIYPPVFYWAKDVFERTFARAARDPRIAGAADEAALFEDELNGRLE